MKGRECGGRGGDERLPLLCSPPPHPPRGRSPSPTAFEGVMPSPPASLWPPKPPANHPHPHPRPPFPSPSSPPPHGPASPLRRAYPSSPLKPAVSSTSSSTSTATSSSTSFPSSFKPTLSYARGYADHKGVPPLSELQGQYADLFHCLPDEVLAVILRELTVDEMLCASLVCRRWRIIGINYHKRYMHRLHAARREKLLEERRLAEERLEQEAIEHIRCYTMHKICIAGEDAVGDFLENRCRGWLVLGLLVLLCISSLTLLALVIFIFQP